MLSFHEWLEKTKIEENLADYTPKFIRKPFGMETSKEIKAGKDYDRGIRDKGKVGHLSPADQKEYLKLSSRNPEDAARYLRKTLATSDRQNAMNQGEVLPWGAGGKDDNARHYVGGDKMKPGNGPNELGHNNIRRA